MRQVAERMTIQEKQKIILAHGPTTSESKSRNKYARNSTYFRAATCRNGNCKAGSNACVGITCDQSFEKMAHNIGAVAQLCRATIEANDDGEFERQKKCGESAMSMIGYIAKRE
jgi:carbamate kinase